MGSLSGVPVVQVLPQIGRARRDARRDGNLLANENVVGIGQGSDEAGGDAGVEGEELGPISGMTKFLLGDAGQAFARTHAVHPNPHPDLPSSAAQLITRSGPSQAECVRARTKQAEWEACGHQAIGWNRIPAAAGTRVIVAMQDRERAQAGPSTASGDSTGARLAYRIKPIPAIAIGMHSNWPMVVPKAR